ncbi:MAG: HU family DNA-binding protein [Candidatus Pacebacteria bacterium]|nr:HU family DNA-binding protein [Candidatus Paceibacterota bacterium]
MTKQDLIEKLAKELNLSKNQAGECLNMILDEISKSLKKGQNVVLTGFGTFSVTKRKSRIGINPRTGERMQISATKTPKFKAGKSLKDSVKKG